ncbi:MAG: esterase/lipase family protein [Nevskiales bacterium]
MRAAVLIFGLAGLVGLAGCDGSSALERRSLPSGGGSTRETGPELRADESDIESAIGHPVQMRNGACDPVLLIHGTGSTSFESWAGTYIPALTAAGFEVFTLDLPGKAYGDIQASAEYLVHALRVIARLSGRPVDVITHSQGGLVARWGLKWWPDTHALVDDLIMLGAPHHGTLIVELYCVAACKPAHFQMQPQAEFIEALNAGDEMGLAASTTSIYSITDELVQPQWPDSTSALPGAANIAIQDLCPGRPVDHVGLMRDGAVYALVLSALLNEGPAEHGRFSLLSCADLLIPGIGAVASLQANYYFFASGNSDVPDATQEPELEPYAQQ